MKYLLVKWSQYWKAKVGVILKLINIYNFILDKTSYRFHVFFVVVLLNAGIRHRIELSTET